MSSIFTFQSMLCALFILQGATEWVTIVRGTIGDCVILDLHEKCTGMNITATWKNGSRLVAKTRSYPVKSSGIYQNRFHAFPNGSLGLCPMTLKDQGQYTAEVFDHRGRFVCHQTIQLEHGGNETASVQEVTGIVGGSVFLPLRHWNDLVQIMWRKGNMSIAGLNYSQSESQWGYTSRFVILANGTLRLDNIQESDCGRYSVEVRNRDGEILYQKMIDLKVEHEMTASTIDPHLLLLTVVGVHVAVFVVVLVSLVWHFRKCKHRTGRMKILSFRHVSLGLNNYKEDNLEPGEGDMCSPDQKEDGNPASQEPETANPTKPGNEVFLENVEETKATTAKFYTEQPLSLNISTFQGIEEPAKSQANPIHAGNTVASVIKDYVPQDDRDCVPPDVNDCSFLEFDDCDLPEYDDFGPPDVNDCGLPEFDDCDLPECDDFGPPDVNDCGPPEFGDCDPSEFDSFSPPDVNDYGPPEFDDFGPPEFDDFGPPEFDDSGPMYDKDNTPMVNGERILPMKTKL